MQSDTKLDLHRQNTAKFAYIYYKWTYFSLLHSICSWPGSLVKCLLTENKITSRLHTLDPGGGALECDGEVSIFKESPQPVWEKIAFQYSVLESLDHKTIGKQ